MPVRGGYGMSGRPSWSYGWGGASRGFGLWGGAWPGATIPVWNPDLTTYASWPNELPDESSGARHPSEHRPRQGYRHGDHVNRHSHVSSGHWYVPAIGGALGLLGFQGARRWWDEKHGVDASGASGGRSWELPIKSVQFGLRTLGLYKGAVNGVMSDELERAVREFQHARGISPDGVVGGATAQRLQEYVPFFMQAPATSGTNPGGVCDIAGATNPGGVYDIAGGWHAPVLGALGGAAGLYGAQRAYHALGFGHHPYRHHPGLRHPRPHHGGHGGLGPLGQGTLPRPPGAPMETAGWFVPALAGAGAMIVVQHLGRVLGHRGIKWAQTVLTRRGFYHGPVDGQPSPELLAAMNAMNADPRYGSRGGQGRGPQILPASVQMPGAPVPAAPTTSGAFLPFMGGLAYGMLENVSENMYRTMTPKTANAWWQKLPSGASGLAPEPVSESGGWLWPALGGYAIASVGDVLRRNRIAQGGRATNSEMIPSSSGWTDGTSQAFHVARGPIAASEKGLDCNVRLFKEGTAWRAVASCSTTHGPFKVEATVDEKALLASGVSPSVVSQIAATTAKTDALTKVGQWNAQEDLERTRPVDPMRSLHQRLLGGDPGAHALFHKLRVHEHHHPRAAAAMKRLRMLHAESQQGLPTAAGWPFPREHAAGIDLDSQRRPQKSLPEGVVAHLKNHLRHAV